MRYEETEPSLPLAHLIAQHWHFALEPHDPEQIEHVIVPDGATSLSIARTGDGRVARLVIAGPSETAHRVPAFRGVGVWGVRLHPAAAPSIGLDAARVRGRLVAVNDVAPTLAETLARALAPARNDSEIRAAFETAIAEWSASHAAPDDVATAAAAALIASHGAARIDDVARKLGVSTRTLRRRFQTAVGLTPKAFARIRRVRHVCVQAVMNERPALSDLSARGGYADQAHLTREFGGVFATSPRLVAEYIRRIEHKGL